ncbi:MAG: hypothetical protein ACYTEK_14250 [Planctomycetota bacterium]
MKTELEPKAKHPVPILLPLTFLVILASISRSQVRLFANSCPWPLKRFVFLMNASLMNARLFARKFSDNSNKILFFFSALDVRRASKTPEQNSVVIKQPDAATKIAAVRCTPAQNQLYMPR